MKLIRVGDKVISWDKVSAALEEILDRRASGDTQQEIATDLGIERTFISHLEGIGAIRYGKRVALLGFPIANKKEVEEVARDFGVEFVSLLSESERKDFLNDKSGPDIFNDVLDVLVELKGFDTVVVLASDRRAAIVEKILEQDVVTIPIGSSPISDDKEVNLEELKAIFATLANEGETENDEGSSEHKPWIFKKRPQRRNRVTRAKV